MGRDETQYDAQYNQLRALNELLKDHSQSQSEVIRQLRTTVIIVSICFTLIICSMIFGFCYYGNQFDVSKTASSVETTTTELKTEGENADINSITNGDMYNDNAIHKN